MREKGQGVRERSQTLLTRNDSRLCDIVLANAITLNSCRKLPGHPQACVQRPVLLRTYKLVYNVLMLYNGLTGTWKVGLEKGQYVIQLFYCCIVAMLMHDSEL